MQIVRRARSEEWTRLLAWLDDGLRDGHRGRLAAEYPVALSALRPEAHLVIEADGTFLSHAFIRRVDAVAAGVPLRLGMIGLVYSDPAVRDRGLGSACVEAATQALRDEGADLVALWTDRSRFYTRLGFTLAGREWLWRLDSDSIDRARTEVATRAGPARNGLSALDVSAPRDDDASALEALLACKPAYVRRAPGELLAAFCAAECETFVARRDGVAVAYTALGRGDDFQSVVHEWAGQPEALLECLAAHLATRAKIGLLSSAAPEPLVACLERAGAVPHPGAFAWLRILDASAVWSSISAVTPGLEGSALSGANDDFVLEAGSTKTPLRHRDVSALIAGPRLPASVLGDLPDPWLAVVKSRLPLPLFVWGFDSI